MGQEEESTNELMPWDPAALGDETRGCEQEKTEIFHSALLAKGSSVPLLIGNKRQLQSLTSSSVDRVSLYHFRPMGSVGLTNTFLFLPPLSFPKLENSFEI